MSNTIPTYTVVFNDCLGGIFIGIADDSNVECRHLGKIHVRKYIPVEEYKHLFNLSEDDFRMKTNDEILHLLKKPVLKPFLQNISLYEY